jgi:hypothetical protein
VQAVFTVIFGASLLAAMVMYRAVLGSFKQPSEMGGVFATARLAIAIIANSVNAALRGQEL